MEKYTKNERIALLVKIFTESPGKSFTLIYFANIFNCSKSTISEDITVAGKLLDKSGLGYIESTPGASGGVMFIPVISTEEREKTLNEICTELSRPERLLQGGYLYNADIICDPRIVKEAARIFSARFFRESIDYIITVETKGIPLAFSTAEHMNLPLVVVRHSMDLSDGAFVSINYLSGSSSKLQSMALPTKALKRNSRLLFVDDYMRAGGTAKGVMDLAAEFECKVVGTGVFIETAAPREKLVENYYSLLTFDLNVKNGKSVSIEPTPH